jgi:SAM-dependent methyltransferase
MTGPLSPVEWHVRFSQQARWTADLRRYLYTRFKIDSARTILDVGCGTGVLTVELERECQANIYGVDIDRAFLKLATRNTQRVILTQGDAHTLPYPSRTFDLVLCHFLLLWVSKPIQVIREMARVARSNGAVIALAEPDYGGRIDYPPEISILGDLQRESLRRQGADPLMGRKLAGLFRQAGLVSIETGVLGGQWTHPPSKDEWESEWRVLEQDLERTLVLHQRPEDLKALDWAANQSGERVLFVPTFYAVGSPI